MDATNAPDFNKDEQTEVSSSTKDSSNLSTLGSGKYIRDADFYFYDGNCVLLAENRLFRIHKSLLTREPSFFQELFSMFSLPQDSTAISSDEEEDMEVCKDIDISVSDESVEGESDENPIVCQDSAQEIRDLCWALYASPGEIVEQQSYETIDLPRIITVLAMAHKYQFENLQNWAFSTIHNAFKDAPKDAVGLVQHCKTWPKINTLFRIIQLCDHKPLSNLIEEELLLLVKKPELEMRRRLKNFSHVLSVVNQVPSLRLLQGKVYHALLCSMDVFVRRTSRRSYDTTLIVDDPASYFDNVLQNPNFKENELSLLKGSWSLTQLGRRLLSAPQELNTPHCAQCMKGWKKWWEYYTSDMSSIDPFEMVERLCRKLNYLGPRVCIGCLETFCAELEEIKAKIEESLPDHFGIP